MSKAPLIGGTSARAEDWLGRLGFFGRGGAGEGVRFLGRIGSVSLGGSGEWEGLRLLGRIGSVSLGGSGEWDGLRLLGRLGSVSLGGSGDGEGELRSLGRFLFLRIGSSLGSGETRDRVSPKGLGLIPPASEAADTSRARRSRFPAPSHSATCIHTRRIHTPPHVLLKPRVQLVQILPVQTSQVLVGHVRVLTFDEGIRTLAAFSRFFQ